MIKTESSRSRRNRDIEAPSHDNTVDPRVASYAHSIGVCHKSKRDRRTEFFFCLFSVVTILCIPPIIYLVAEPLKTTATNSEAEVVAAEEILDEMDLAMTSITSSLGASALVARKTPAKFTFVCPLESSDPSNTTLISETKQESVESAKSSLRILHALIVDNLSETLSMVRVESRGFERFHSKFKNVYRYAESTQSQIKMYTWFLPVLLVFTFCASVALMVGVHCSRRRQTNQKFRRILSYGILPIILITAMVAALFAAGSAVCVIVADDACNGGSENGSPHDTIMDVLKASDINSFDRVYTYTAAFTGECAIGSDPTEKINTLGQELQESINEIFAALAEVDKVERSLLASECGVQPVVIDKLLLDSRNQVAFLANIRRALENMTGTLSCGRMYPLYIASVEGTACTEVSESLAWGLIFFFLLGISAMCMITLRAAWQHEHDDDEMYDEDEEIENMFVDEHEEYLVYISKFRHEWEEFEEVDRDNSDHKSSSAMPALYSVGFGSTFGTGSRTQSETESGEGCLPGEEGSEDEFVVNVNPNAQNGQEQQVEDGPFDSNMSDAFSPMTIESEITFVPFRDTSPSMQDQTTRQADSTHNSLLDGDDFVNRLKIVIEEQHSRDLDLAQQLSREVEREKVDELRTMRELAMWETEHELDDPVVEDSSLPEDELNLNESTSIDTPMIASPAEMEISPTKSTESSVVSFDTSTFDAAQSYFGDPPQEPDSPVAGIGKIDVCEDGRSSDGVFETSEFVPVEPDSAIDATDLYVLHEEVSSGPVKAASEDGSHNEEEVRDGLYDPEGVLALMPWDVVNRGTAIDITSDQFFFEHPPSPPPPATPHHVVQDDEEAPVPVESFGYPEPLIIVESCPLPKTTSAESTESGYFSV